MIQKFKVKAKNYPSLKYTITRVLETLLQIHNSELQIP